MFADIVVYGQIAEAKNDIFFENLPPVEYNLLAGQSTLLEQFY